VAVTETFFAVEVEDMQRAIAFYVSALGATVLFSSARWSSLRIAGVRVGLALSPERMASTVGLHFAVSDLATRGRLHRLVRGRSRGRCGHRPM
jgi:extradiol dioxygenase family protein